MIAGCVVKRAGVLRALAQALVYAADCFRLGSSERTRVVRDASLRTIEVHCLDRLGTKQRAFLASLRRLERLRISSVLVFLQSRLVAIQFL